MDSIKEATDKASHAIDEGFSRATEAIHNGASTAQTQYSWARTRAEELYETGYAHLHASIDQGFGFLRDGVHWTMDHPNVSYGAGAAALLIGLPGPRRFLWRQTLGRLRSDEAALRSAEVRTRHLTEAVAAEAGEMTKLQQRLTAAQEQYDSGLAKLRATRRLLQSLSSTVSKTERRAGSLIENLRELPSSQALRLRSEVAAQRAAAQKQRAALDRQVYNLSKKGI